MEGRWLHPRREGGKLLFDAEEVERAREHVRERPVRSADGELAARAAELFAAGKSTMEVVVVLRVTPARLRELRRELAEPDDLIVPGDVVAEIRDLGFAGSGPAGRLAPEDLPRILRRLLAAARRIAAGERSRTEG